MTLPQQTTSEECSLWGYDDQVVEVLPMLTGRWVWNLLGLPQKNEAHDSTVTVFLTHFWGMSSTEKYNHMIQLIDVCLSDNTKSIGEVKQRHIFECQVLTKSCRSPSSKLYKLCIPHGTLMALYSWGHKGPMLKKTEGTLVLFQYVCPLLIEQYVRVSIISARFAFNF